MFYEDLHVVKHMYKLYISAYLVYIRLVSFIEIDTLEYQQTEKTETELKDVDRIRIRKVYACCPGWHSGGAIRALLSVINICCSTHLSAPH
jgi:hypothetical protein